MSKGNMLLGYARGKVGSLVFTRRKGEQITRARNSNPTNPRTPLQVFQRMKMYAPVAFYKASIATQFKYAFEDQRANETAFNAFMRHNIGVAPWTSKSLASQYAPIPFAVQMSAGSAPGVEAWIGNYKSTPAGSIEDYAGVGLYFGENSSIDSATVGELSISVLAVNQLLREGDMLTFVGVRSTGLAVVNGNVDYAGVSGFDFSYAQVVLNKSDNTPLSNLGIFPAWKADESSHPKGVMFRFATYPWENEQWCYGGCIIVSRKVGDKIIASSTTLELNETADDIATLMKTEAYRDKAAVTYRVGDTALLDPVK